METIDYLLERYPEPFVHAICTGAYCVVGGNWDVFPLLDMAGNRLSTAATLYAVVQSYENLSAINGAFQQDVALINWNKAAEQLALGKRLGSPAPESKEGGRRREERQARHEGRADQPWRKRHR
jgi:hypothetical protein